MAGKDELCAHVLRTLGHRSVCVLWQLQTRLVTPLAACLRLENGGISRSALFGDPTGYIEMYRSDDDALIWRLVSRPVLLQ